MLINNHINNQIETFSTSNGTARPAHELAGPTSATALA